MAATHPQPKKKTAKRWSQRVTNGSDALDLEAGVFTSRSPKAIAASLKRSAERSTRRKASPYQSAMSMLTFYLNRGGKQLSATKKQTLERAKGELRTLFGK
jgi:uncharacterized protein DUF3175